MDPLIYAVSSNLGRTTGVSRIWVDTRITRQIQLLPRIARADTSTPTAPLKQRSLNYEWNHIGASSPVILHQCF